MSVPNTPARADTIRSITSDSDESSLHSLEANVSIGHFVAETEAFEQVLAEHAGYSEQTDKGAFDDLVGKHLTASERAAARHAVKLAQRGPEPEWTPTSSSSSLTNTIVEEPESYSEGPDTDVAPTADSESDDASSTDCDIPPPTLYRSGTQDSDIWRLEPEEIVRLLVEEFGPLAADGVEEKLILEADGGLVKDISIVGVIHLTTHRVAFHASLLATLPTQIDRVIKAGTVVVHRKGWHAKRRLWLELSPDMVCTYASSKEADRIRPIRSVLLSAIHRIVPKDPKQPKYVRIIFETSDFLDKGDAKPRMTGVLEFDTEEAAIDWRKEMAAAVFLYRHRKREALGGADVDNGIRFSCPLGRIESVSFLDEATPSLASLVIPSDSDELPEKGTTVRMGTLYSAPPWQDLPKHVATYKARSGDHPQAPVFCDMGPLAFSDAENDVEGVNLQEKRIRSVLALGAEKSLWIVRASVYRSIASSGFFVISDHYVSFWCRSLAQDDLQYRLPFSMVRKAREFSSFGACSFGLALELEGHNDLRFVFRADKTRQDALKRINTISQTHTRSGSNTPVSPTPLTRSATTILSPIERSMAAVVARGTNRKVVDTLPKAINMPRELLTKQPPKHFVCLTIGSRGDVQPYIALGLGLMKEGHSVTIVTHDEYKAWIEGFGIKHKQAGGDPGALMKLSVENKMFSPEFFKQSLQNFRPWLDQLLLDSWESCQGADVLLESPSTMSGVHIAEALNIPYFRTFTMPWTKTSDFPHAFLSPPVDAPTFNSASYVLFTNVMWAATSGQINRWRRQTLKIGNTDMNHLAQSKIPFIYNFSQAVVPKPLDWSDSITVTGYWFLDNPEGVNWTPPQDLVDWMAQARKDGKPIVYIGFGSITVPHPNKTTARIVKAVLESDVRAIISKGWSARMSKVDKDPEVVMPPQCYELEKIPHDWLFPKIDAAVHHGGAGTTGASLRAGIPTLIKPWFGDQFFWASRVQKLGAGLKISSLHGHELADALTKATTSRIMKEKAAAVGEKIRAEDGVHTAIHTIYTLLPRAGEYIEKIREH